MYGGKYHCERKKNGTDSHRDSQSLLAKDGNSGSN